MSTSGKLEQMDLSVAQWDNGKGREWRRAPLKC